MTKDWGYAALVEINGKRILFDTGDDPAIFAKNVKAKGVDLTKLDFVVLSHRHSDHVSGVSYLLSVNPKVKNNSTALENARLRMRLLHILMRSPIGLLRNCSPGVKLGPRGLGGPCCPSGRQNSAPRGRFQ